MPPATCDTRPVRAALRPFGRRKRAAWLTTAILLSAGFAAGQTADSDSGSVTTAIEGLKLRGIGPP